VLVSYLVAAPGCIDIMASLPMDARSLRGDAKLSMIIDCLLIAAVRIKRQRRTDVIEEQFHGVQGRSTGNKQCSVKKTTASAGQQRHHRLIHCCDPSQCMPVSLHFPLRPTRDYAVFCCQPEYYATSCAPHSSSFPAFEHRYCANLATQRDN
jgi:hypothetical protein